MDLSRSFDDVGFGFTETPNEIAKQRAGPFNWCRAFSWGMAQRSFEIRWMSASHEGMANLD